MKEYFIKVGNERVPVDQKVYEEYYKSKERMRYIHKVEKDRVISYDQALVDDLPLEAMMKDRQELVEDIVINRLLIEDLKICIDKLEEDERSLLTMLFHEDMSEREIGTLLGIPRTTLQSRKHLILKRLKKLLDL